MATKPRSPNYPGFGLQKAVDYARKVYAENHLHKASREVVAKALGYGTLNGKSATAISALKKFGLLIEEGNELRITTDALTVIAEPASSPERARLLVKMATMPSLFAELATAFPGDKLPSDEILRSWLLRKGFLPTTVDLPIRAYRDTMELAIAQKTLYTEVSKPPESKRQPDADEFDGQDDEPEVGDLIQWESSGVLRMEAPRRVRGKTEHDGAWWVFVEGSETGIPMDEAIIVERKAPEAKQPPVLPLPPAPQPDRAGEVEASRGKLGEGVTYRLLVTGEMRAKQIGKLIRLLEAQKAVLDDDDEDIAD